MIWHNERMPRFHKRHSLVSVSILLLGIVTGVWIEQGRGLFTVPKLAHAEPDRALEELFAPTGVQDELGSVRSMDRGFRLGLLPSGFGTGMVSVSTLGATIGVVWLISSARRPSGACRRDRCRRSACP